MTEKKYVNRQHGLIEELTRCNTEMQDDFESKLQLLSQRGVLNQNEMKKITDLNAEIFGHSNNRQKIRYVAQLKDENLALKKENMRLVQSREDFKKKWMALEEENSAVKTLGGGGFVRRGAGRMTRGVLGELDQENNNQ